ncbi:MAG: hypothetical protein HY046_13230 [Acidobacteria bacterium]|nr:hypothetical protein [Acidobacteriota bacterium]
MNLGASAIKNPAREPRGGAHRRQIQILCVLALAGLSSGAAPPAQKETKGERRVTDVHVVVNFMDLPRHVPSAPGKPPAIKFKKETERPPRPVLPPWAVSPKNVYRTPQVQAPLHRTASPATSANFQAVLDDGTSIPPDTMGVIGPSHLLTALNSTVSMQDRTGTAVKAVDIDVFWSPTGAGGVFDPRLAYDPFGQRWIFTAASGGQTTGSSLLVGTSKTSDPTGFWDLHKITVGSTGGDWGDYPSMGFNKDWVVVTLNMFTLAGDNFDKENIYVFKKSDLYSGIANAAFTQFSDTIDAFAQLPAITYDNSLATMYLVDDFNGNSSGQGVIRVSTITGPVGSESYTRNTAFVSVNNTWDSGPSTDFLPQSGNAAKINAGDSRLLTVVYRNGSLWAAQNAFLPAASPTRCSAQWWQFSPLGAVLQFGRVDDPSGVIFHAYPSIAVNAQNDVLLGFGLFSSTSFASGGYAFRAASDPANTMQSDSLLKAGVAPYLKKFTGTDNRWGDYSNTSVDPANDLDLWTIQEYAEAQTTNPVTSFWGTRWGKITAPASKKRRGQTISQ